MPGSYRDPVILDQYQTIVEVGWPSAIVLEVRVYTVATAVNPQPIKCEPVVGDPTFKGITWIPGTKFQYAAPTSIAQNAHSPVKSAQKWMVYTEEERAAAMQSAYPNRKGKWVSMSLSKFTFSGFPPSPFLAKNFPAWTKFGLLIRWDELGEGDTRSKYYVPQTAWKTGSDLYFDTGTAMADVYTLSVPMSGTPLCFGPQNPGAMGATMANPNTLVAYKISNHAAYQFGSVGIEFQTELRGGNEGEVVFHSYEVVGLQITPKPWPVPVQGDPTMPPSYSPEIGPATIWLLCKRSGRRTGVPGS